MQPDNQQSNNNPYYPSAQNAGVVQPSMSSNQQMIPMGQVPVPTGVSSSGGGSSLLWIIALIVTGLLLVGALVFGFWAYGERGDYKANVDEKVAAAVGVAQEQTKEEMTIQFAEDSKSPLKKYVGPASYGSVEVEYPKTWSGYIASSDGNSSTPLSAYFHPDVVPAVVSSNNRQAIALKVEVLNQAYDQVVSRHSGSITNGDLVAVPYALPKVPEQVGVRFSGKLDQQLNGVQVVLPLRDKTLVVTTETDKYLEDFEKHILPHLIFVP